MLAARRELSRACDQVQLGEPIDEHLWVALEDADQAAYRYIHGDLR